jgi:hypothetical protein
LSGSKTAWCRISDSATEQFPSVRKENTQPLCVTTSNGVEVFFSSSFSFWAVFSFSFSLFFYLCLSFERGVTRVR